MTRVCFANLTTLLLAVSSMAVEARCWDTGHSIRCAPGCELLQPPRFSGDFFSWRCRRPAPPPPQAYSEPQSFCPAGEYPVTDELCCPSGTVYRGGRCNYPQQSYRSPGAGDPTPLLIALATAVFIFLAWYDQHARQLAIARATEDMTEDTADIESATERMNAAADEADDILRRFRDLMSEDGE